MPSRGWLAVVGLALVAGPLHGQALGPVEVSGGLTAVGQATNADAVRSEVVSSLDLFVAVPLGPLRLEGYVEANTTPRRDGVSRFVGEANTDAGTALTRRRTGRVQLSELRLAWPISERSTAYGGLIDATGFLDVSRIANDENLFFLGVPFVNNPTIEFPDYALGVAFERAAPGVRGIEVAFTATSSHGLADNPAVSYAQLVDLTEAGKGVFAGTTVRWTGEGRRASIGAWMNSADHPELNGSGRTHANRGVYTVLGWFRGRHSVSARAGIGNGDVSEARAYTGITYLWAERPNAIGLAIGRTFASDAVAGLSDVLHGEAFMRRRLVQRIFITLSVQRLHNSGFDGLGRTLPPRLWVGGLRLSTQF